MTSHDYESLVDKSLSYIKNAIHEEKFKPGERLLEVKIAKEIGVSRAPVREAFRILEIEGLVEVTPRKGVRVREYTIQDIENIYILRINLDSLAARLGIPNLNKSDMNRIDDILQKMEVCVHTLDFDRYKNLNSEFHELFYKRSKNQWLTQIYYNLENNIKHLRTLSITVKGRLKESYIEHLKIVSAIKEGKTSEAEGRMKLHMERAGKSLSTALLKKSVNPLLKHGFKPSKNLHVSTPMRDLEHNGMNFSRNNPFDQIEIALDRLQALIIRISITDEHDIALERYPIDICCVRRFDIAEIVTMSKEKEITAAKIRVARLCFIEFQYGGILITGDSVGIGGEIIGEVAASIENHFSCRLMIIIKTLKDVSQLRCLFNSGQPIWFASKKRRKA